MVTSAARLDVTDSTRHSGFDGSFLPPLPHFPVCSVHAARSVSFPFVMPVPPFFVMVTSGREIGM
jgi:hypothetical protein